MTNEEAIREILFQVIPHYNQTISGEALSMAVAALEKQMPKKPISVQDKSIDAFRIEHFYSFWKCPMCGNVIRKGKGCDNNGCRQAIDWIDNQ